MLRHKHNNIVSSVLAILAISFRASKAIADGTPPPSSNSSIGAGNIAGPISVMSDRELWLSCIILIFGLATIVVQFFLLKQAADHHTDEVAKIFTVTLIIIGTLVLISSGFSSEQIAPALGLFGTIAGYLLGKAEGRRSPEVRDKLDS